MNNAYRLESKIKYPLAYVICSTIVRGGIVMSLTLRILDSKSYRISRSEHMF